MPVALSRGGNDLPSRVADNLFWLGRYAERAEGLTRLLRGVLVRLTETSGLAESPELPMLLRAVTFMSESHPGFVGEGSRSATGRPRAELLAVIYDTRRARAAWRRCSVPCAAWPGPSAIASRATCGAS